MNIAKLPKSSYIVCDPCYVMRDEHYSEMCDKINFERDAKLSIEVAGHTMGVCHTAYGDGAYSSNCEPRFLVDSGLIACTPLSLCDPKQVDRQLKAGEAMLFVGEEITFGYEDGTFHINSLQITTGDMYEDDEEEDDYYEEDDNDDEDF